MPELVKDGPFIPGELINFLAQGKVVFFCGAGISVGTGLPGFPGLVQGIYKNLGDKPDDVEWEALDLPDDEDWAQLDLENLPSRITNHHHPKYDKVFDLLEREARFGRSRHEDASRVRELVVKQLKARTKGTLNVHRSLLELSRTKRGARLVTRSCQRKLA